VRFWDASALVPLVIAERQTAHVEQWLRADPAVVVWTLTRVEVLSALARRRRAEPAASRKLLRARQEILQAWERWTEIVALDPVRRQAERVLEIYPLRAADALQLGAALVAAEERPATLDFVTLDRTLGDAAAAEGFPVLGTGED
jgi:predicted nucleic acid-binding protein